MGNRCFFNTIFFLVVFQSLIAIDVQASISVTDTITLNGTWAFKTDLYNRGEMEGWHKDDWSNRGWSEMQVPGNWDLKNEYSRYVGKAWYRREIDIEGSWKHRNVRIVFESVYHDASVWVNGKLVGENHLGYLPFSFDLNEFLHFGKKNRIVVMVDNTHRRGAMWNWGGIRRPVWLEVTDKSRLEFQRITAMPDLKSGNAQVHIDFGISNFGDTSDELRHELIVFYDGQIVWQRRDRETISIAPSQGITKQVSFKLSKDKVKLWHFNNPHLYHSVVRLYRGERLIHELIDRFGIRKVEVDSTSIKLNGEPIRAVGFNIVPEDRITGSTLPLWRIMEDVDRMKALGANMARLSHQPLPKDYLNYLDEKGIMTFEEVGLWGKDEWVDPAHPRPKEWLKRMVEHKYNHPAVIGWSVGNEIGYFHLNPKVSQYVKGAIQQAKRQDSTRLAVYVSNSVETQKEDDPVRFCDLIMLNRYRTWGKSVEKVNKHHVGKPIFYSEFGYKMTSEDPNLGIIPIGDMLDEMRNRPYLVGASYWTFNDYRSAYPNTSPSENRSWGVFNSFREPKRAYAQFRKAYAPVKKFVLEGTSRVFIEPRAMWDIPAYKLRGYRLVWGAYGEDEMLRIGGIDELPEMTPGDKPYYKSWEWERSLDSMAKIKISMLDPLGYAVCDTVVYLKSPRKPEILAIHGQNETIRVVFKKGNLATSWKAKYGLKGQDLMTTPETINNFIDIPNVKIGGDYVVQVLAINNTGESRPSDEATITVGAGELPPIIWHTERVADGFFVGYSVDEYDDRYQIQYGNIPGDYDRFHTRLLSTKGVGNVLGLERELPYYYRIRRLMKWGYASDWSHEIRVEPANGAVIVQPRGVLRKGKVAVLAFNPVSKAIGYRIRYTMLSSGKVNSIYVKASYINYALVKGLSENEHYKFEIAATTENGEGRCVSF